jgi:hypothetical protein
MIMPVMTGLAGAETVLRLECCSIRAGLCTETLRLMAIALYCVRLRVVSYHPSQKQNMIESESIMMPCFTVFKFVPVRLRLSRMLRHCHWQRNTRNLQASGTLVPYDIIVYEPEWGLWW